ncbi:MAG: hypothetical protein ACREQY_21540 [Candidatus Binatia bacterium]
MSEALGVYRERRFSPGKIEDDAAILDSTAARLREAGVRVRMIDGEALAPGIPEPDLVFAMCQGEQALAALERFGCPVINAPSAIRGCFRVNLVERLSSAGVPHPRWRFASGTFPADLGPGPWLKRGDVHAMEAADVRRIFREEEWPGALEELSRRGVSRAIVQEHRNGEVYKFYGVIGGFFRAFGLPAALTEPAAALADAGARALGLAVYGGDGVCESEGTLTLVDFNDWPSFSRCREEASRAIGAHLLGILRG